MKRIIILATIFLSLIASSFAGLGSDGLQVIKGQWDVDNQKNVYVEQSGLALSVLEDDIQKGETIVNFKLTISDYKSENGFFVFDYKSPEEFKYAGARAGNDRLVIGQYENGKFKDSTNENEEIDPLKTYDVQIKLEGTQVILILDDNKFIKKNFPLTFNEKLGFAVDNSKAVFGSVQINSTQKNYSHRFQNIYDIKPTSNSGLDEMLNIIKNDEGLQSKVPYTDIQEALFYSNEMNKIIIKSIKETGIANDEKLTSLDLKILDKHIYENYFTEFKTYHGDDENGDEYGFHLVQNDGATTKLFDKNAVNTIIDGIYHVGFGSANKNNIYNEDLNNNQKYSDLAYWLSYFLKDDLKDDSLKSQMNNQYEFSLISGELYQNEKELYLASNDKTGMVLFEKEYDTDNLEVEFNLSLTQFEKSKNAKFIFDYNNANNFKYAGIDPKSKQWVIGQYVNGKNIDKAKKSDIFPSDSNYRINIKLTNGKVALYKENIETLEYDFDTSLDNKMGFATSSSTSIFSNIIIKGEEKKGIISSFFSFFY